MWIGAREKGEEDAEGELTILPGIRDEELPSGKFLTFPFLLHLLFSIVPLQAQGKTWEAQMSKAVAVPLTYFMPADESFEHLSLNFLMCKMGDYNNDSNWLLLKSHAS